MEGFDVLIIEKGGFNTTADNDELKETPKGCAAAITYLSGKISGKSGATAVRHRRQAWKWVHAP